MEEAEAREIATQVLFHAVRAEMLHRLGDDRAAASAYEFAIERTDNTAERDHLTRRLQALDR